MSNLFDSLRCWTRRNRGWATLLLVMGLVAQALPVTTLAASMHARAVATPAPHACAQATSSGAYAAPAPDAISSSPVDGCCADIGHLCAAHCAPLILIGLDLSTAAPEPAPLVSGHITEPTHHVLSPLLRPPRA